MNDLTTARSAVVGGWEEPPNAWLTARKNASFDWALNLILESCNQFVISQSQYVILIKTSFCYRASSLLKLPTFPVGLKCLVNNKSVFLWIQVKEMITTETLLYQIFSNAFDWSKRITSLNIPQLKLENIRVILPNFQERVLRKTVDNNMLFEKICCWQFTGQRSRKTARFSEQIVSVDRYLKMFSRQMEAIVYI